MCAENKSGGSATKGELITGALETRLMSWRSQDTSSGCSSYVLWTNEYVVVIDPDSSPDVTAEILDHVMELRRELPRQACICLTHSHRHHSLGAMKLIHEMPDLLLLCHIDGASAFRDQDTLSDMAQQLNLPSTPAPDLMPLFAGPNPAGVERKVETPGGGLRSLSIPIGIRDSLQVYHIPGHSPDSLCYRVGGALFTGDIADMDNPALDKISAIHSFEKILWLLDHINIAEIYPGHGPMLTRKVARSQFQEKLIELN